MNIGMPAYMVEFKHDKATNGISAVAVTWNNVAKAAVVVLYAVVVGTFSLVYRNTLIITQIQSEQTRLREIAVKVDSMQSAGALNDIRHDEEIRVLAKSIDGLTQAIKEERAERIAGDRAK
jgi:hypothetical protein